MVDGAAGLAVGGHLDGGDECTLALGGGVPSPAEDGRHRDDDHEQAHDRGARGPLVSLRSRPLSSNHFPPKSHYKQGHHKCTQYGLDHSEDLD